MPKKKNLPVKPVRIITPPITKKCLALDAAGRPLKYDEVNKRLSFVNWKDFTEFPTKHAAHSAIWHTVENLKLEGVPEPWNLFILEEA